ncbi:polycystin-1-like protein 1 [Halichoeres trimaculatus]|uniref:polycystin-1-like protein 1 n=1 Tax=Halichoeres trimaculatus TaxID=147232 RepID=UPI003D9DE191
MSVPCFSAIVSFFCLLSATVPPSDHRESPWSSGCVNGSVGLYVPEGAGDPDPVTCCARCLDERLKVAGVTSDGCFCGNWVDDIFASECFNASHSGDPKDVQDKKTQSVFSSPGRSEDGSVSLYRTEGPFLHRICLTVTPHTVQPGKKIMVKVSGRLAGRLNQPTGDLAVGGQGLSFVKVEFEGRTPKGQSSQHVSVFDYGSFAWSSDWIFAAPGKYKLNVTVSNPLSTLSSTLHLSIFQPAPHSVVISVLHGPLGVPSCSPSSQSDMNNRSVEAVYLGDSVTLQAHLADRLSAEFSWRFTNKKNGKNKKDIKTACLPFSDCINSTVTWTFETEGVHMVSVKASGAFGWTQEIIHIVVVRPAGSDLRASVPGDQLTPSEGDSLNVSFQIKSTMPCVMGNRMSSQHVPVNQTWQPPTSQSPVHSLAHNVQIYAAKQAYPTNTDVTFLAVAQAPDPVELLWYFGDSTSNRTTSRTITKRYKKPGRYDVVVVMSSSWSTVTSDVFPLVIQRAVKLNKLLHTASVLQNQTVTLSCRVNVGTDVTFLWSFGDGSSRMGQSTERHTYYRTGEFKVNVIVSNLVSSASLSSPIFVVDRPCQPPPVKNMGPLKVQVRRYEVIRLGVTYDAEVNCSVTFGLHYTWTLFDSKGHVFALPLVHTHRQSLTLPGLLLHYDTYTAVARVQVLGSVVYSNYSVSVQVIPSPPVAYIQGSTNILINNRNTTVVTLDGQRSHDPDFPNNLLSFSWTCKPVSSIPSSCFHQNVPTSSPVLSFPASALKDSFDQFQFTFTVHSGERTASTETFVTLSPNVVRKISVYCSQCQGELLSWDQSFSVSAVCEDCGEYVQYSWSLYMVNASSRPVIDVPFCFSMDLGAPSNIFESSATSPQTPGASTVFASVTSSASEIRARQPNLNPRDILSANNKQKSKLTEVGPISSEVNVEIAGSGEEPFYHPQGELLYSPTEYQSLALDNSSVQYSSHFDHSDVISEFPIDSDSSTDWDLSSSTLESRSLRDQEDPDYDVTWIIPEEGDPGISAGRLTDDDEPFTSRDYSVFDPAFHEDKGSNLVDDRPVVTARDPILLDLSRDPVDPSVFETYTYTGTLSPSLSFRPFSLRAGSRYMLEVTARSKDSFLGRSQLFLKTNPTPKGMMCQVQPITGRELFTHFSIFCTSGKQDLVYEHSFSVGDKPPRMLYQGRDFQFYFSLPSGDPNDDYKVTLYTVIRSSTHGTATKPCPVTVRVQPSFSRDNSSSSHLDPDQELSEAGLRNLSALLQLGNSDEIRNYVSLLSDILDRLSRDPEANTHAQRHTRNVLICTMCDLESNEQASMFDNICILRNLLEVTHQVTFANARRVTSHVRVISERLTRSRTPGWYHLDQRTLNALVALLSHSLQAAGGSDNFMLETNTSGDTEPHSQYDTIEHPPANSCMMHSSSYKDKQRPSSAKQRMQLVSDILQTTTDLMLKYILFHGATKHRVSTGFLTLYVSYQNQTSTVIRSDSSTFYLPPSLIQHVFNQHRRETERPCFLSVLTELTHSPYIPVYHPGRLSGSVVDLSLYGCSTKRKIPVRSFFQPINIELQPPQRNESHDTEHVLLCGQINYHSFNITQQHLQQAVQLSVVFKAPAHKAFPIMLLFRMFERPTPSMHHLRKIHHWGSSSTRIILPPSYLNAAGVGHLALLNANFEKAARLKYLNKQVSYSLTVNTHLCLSWNDHQGAWTQHGCGTQQTDTSAAVTCSCQQLSPLTVVQQQIQSSFDTASLDPLLRVQTDLRVLGVLMLCVCLYIPGFVVCRRADRKSEANQRAHFLSDNSPHDLFHYGVTIHTGPCSAAHMSAKVYIMLKGEDGFSQTKELQAPGCTLFKRNSHDTFILSTANSLGAVCGVHIWHDSSGPSPTWYLHQVEVSELNRGDVKGHTWFFVAQCWLAVNKGDGQVERRLQVCNKGIGFAEMLSLKLSEYLTDHHMWISIYRCPCPHSFTRTQRLSVSLLLLMGYVCANMLIISQTDEQLLFEVGFINLSARSMTTGILSVAAVLPAAAFISFLFRLHELRLTGSESQHTKCEDTEKDFFIDALSVPDNASESHLFWSSLHQWGQGAWTNKFQGTDLQSMSSTHAEPAVQTDVALRKEHALVVHESSWFYGSQKALLLDTMDGGQTCQVESHLGEKKEKVPSHSRCGEAQRPNKRGVRPVSEWSHHVAWILCVLLIFSSLVLSAVLGLRFSSGKFLLWIHSLFFSLIYCIFFIQPAMIITVAAAVSFWSRKKAAFHHLSKIKESEVRKLWSKDSANQQKDQFRDSAFSHRRRCSNLDKLLEARQRARYLLHVRPPTQTQLRKSRGEKRKHGLLCKTFRDLCVCLSMLILMLCINYNSLSSDHNRLIKAARKHLIGGQDSEFMSIQKHDDWWKWAQTSLLSLLYKHESTTKTHIRIGEPILWKMEDSISFQNNVSSATLHSLLLGRQTPTHLHHIVMPPRPCGQLGCYSGQSAPIGLGYRKSDAASKLKLLRSGGWLSRQTAAVKVQFTVFSPAANLFTSVTLLLQRNPAGVLIPSVRVQSVRLYHTPAVWDYAAVACRLLFLILSLLQLWDQVYFVWQQGLMGYWRMPCNWLEVSLLLVTLVYYAHYIYHSVIFLEVVELLERHDHRGHVDVTQLAECEQCIRSLCGALLFLLSIRFVSVLRLIRTFATSATLLTHTVSKLFWPMISGLVLMSALSCSGNLLVTKTSRVLTLLPCSPHTLVSHYWGHRPLQNLLHTRCDLLYWGLLKLSSLMWTAMAVGVVSSLVRRAKASRNRRNTFTVTELTKHIRRRVFNFTGNPCKHAWAENEVERRTHHLEEFESLLDELLFKLNVQSDSLHHMLPPKAHQSRTDSPEASLTQEQLHTDTQNFIQLKDDTKANNRTDDSDYVGILPSSHMTRSKLEVEAQSLQHQRKAEEKCVSPQESESNITVWTKEMLHQFDQRTAKENSCWLSNVQATHTEVVEVLVHDEPGSLLSN